MNLNELQSVLERIYDVSTPHRVEDFLLQDPQVANQLADDASAHQCPEKLLVAQNEDGVDVSLFLHQAVVARLKQDNPAISLHEGNLQDFWFALEGVSHFLYLVWNATFQRPITQLELELIAEVDKYVTTVALVQQQRGNVPLGPLRRTLFENVRFRTHLDQAQRQRYQDANRFAARYCHALERRYGADHGDPALMRELRRFYRLPQGEKIRHIETRVSRDL